MTPDADERQLTGYLLGQLRADEETRVEERYLADPEFHEKLRAVERDLIDQYVRGELPDAAAFERRYLSSPPLRAKVEFARALMQSAGSPARDSAAADRRARWPQRLFGRQPPAWQIAAAALVIVAGTWIVIGRPWQRPGLQPGSGGSASVTVQPGQPPPDPRSSQPSPPESRPTPAVALLVLVPNAIRGSDAAPTLAIGANTDVRLQLALEAADYTRYRTVVRTADGREVWREENLTPARSSSGPSVTTTIPAARFADDDYTVRVGGITARGEVDEVSGYAFRVRRQR